MIIIKLLIGLMLVSNPLIGFAPPSQVNQNSEKQLPEVQAAFLPVLKTVIEPSFPIKNYNVPEPELTAQSALVYNIDSKKIYLSKDIFTQRPIASLTKLMTSLIAINHIPLDQEIIINEEAVAAYGEIGDLNVNEKITFQNLLYILMLASSNDAASAIAQNIDNLINKMNLQAKEWGLSETYFEDASGISPNNKSSAWEIGKILEQALNNQVLAKIMNTSETDVYSQGGLKPFHHLANTNVLLKSQLNVFAGKTGFTDEAGECMAVAAKAPNQDTLIFIVLNSKDRTTEIKKLISWINQAYVWE